MSCNAYDITPSYFTFFACKIGLQEVPRSYHKVLEPPGNMYRRLCLLDSCDRAVPILFAINLAADANHASHSTRKPSMSCLLEAI